MRQRLTWREATAYMSVQIAGCCSGALLAHCMFDLPLIESSTHIRAGGTQMLAEFVATFGLLLVVLGHRRAENAPWMAAAWIGAAYWFTASTSFANPAITIARSMTNTFSGIRPVDAPWFIVAQVAGAVMLVRRPRCSRIATWSTAGSTSRLLKDWGLWSFV
jgi:glycerol uptake facilitator-like aquaporin